MTTHSYAAGDIIIINRGIMSFLVTVIKITEDAVYGSYQYKAIEDKEWDTKSQNGYFKKSDYEYERHL